MGWSLKEKKEKNLNVIVYVLKPQHPNGFQNRIKETST